MHTYPTWYHCRKQTSGKITETLDWWYQTTDRNTRCRLCSTCKRQKRVEILGVRVGDLRSSDMRKDLGKARQGNLQKYAFSGSKIFFFGGGGGGTALSHSGIEDGLLLDTTYPTRAYTALDPLLVLNNSSFGCLECVMANSMCKTGMNASCGEATMDPLLHQGVTFPNNANASL